MNITKHIGFGPGNFKINLMRYKAEVETKNGVLFLHGQGEAGPADGSQLLKVERWGWPGFSKGIRPGESASRGTVEYGFDLVVPQAIQPETGKPSWSGHVKGLIPFMCYLGYENIAVVGISMGGYGTYDILNEINDPLGKVIGFVNCCGSESTVQIPKMHKRKGMHWHGTADKTVLPEPAEKFVDAYNLAGGEVEFISLQGVAHNAWDYAFKSDASQDRSLAFVNELFASRQVPATPQLSQFKEAAKAAIDLITL